jgi:hypothetical protein
MVGRPLTGVVVCACAATGSMKVAAPSATPASTATPRSPRNALDLLDLNTGFSPVVPLVEPSNYIAYALVF